MATDPPILVGLRLEGVPDYRRRNWEFNRARWEQTLGWPIYEGHDNPPGPFNMSAASNRAAAAAGDWEVALYVGGDFLLADMQQAVQACASATRTGKMTFAHNWLTQLDEAETEALLEAGPTADPQAAAEPAYNTFSGALAIPRSMWDEVGGFDERFVGWGYEDIAFWAACFALRGYDRVDGHMFHLWHPRSRADNEENPDYAANQVLGTRYLAARTSAVTIRRILAEREGL